MEHYWWVRWSVEEPRVSEVLSYPSVHVVFEGADAQIVGIVRKRFARRLESHGAVCAIKFRPGMFRCFHGAPAWRLTDRSSPLGDELGRGARALADELRALPSETDRAARLEGCLRAVLPAAPPEATIARQLVERARTDPELLHASQLASASGLGLRALQRLFREYVGVGPKWVVRRFRLQEAAALLQRGAGTVASIAASLGYFDQAHFVHDFKAVVGTSPTAYARLARHHQRGGAAT